MRLPRAVPLAQTAHHPPAIKRRAMAGADVFVIAIGGGCSLG
jgi:hypothetical protein